MLQNPCKTLGFKKNMVYKIPPGGGGGGKPYPASGLNVITATNPSPSSHEINTVKKRGPFPVKEMYHKFGKIVIFSKQYKILEIRKCYPMALVFTFDIPQIVSSGT